jgi:hypothetical protein
MIVHVNMLCPSMIDGVVSYRNLSLGFMTKVRACKGAGQEWARASHFMLLGV